MSAYKNTFIFTWKDELLNEEEKVYHLPERPAVLLGASIGIKKKVEMLKLSASTKPSLTLPISHIKRPKNVYG